MKAVDAYEGLPPAALDARGALHVSAVNGQCATKWCVFAVHSRALQHRNVGARAQRAVKTHQIDALVCRALGKPLLAPI